MKSSPNVTEAEVAVDDVVAGAAADRIVALVAGNEVVAGAAIDVVVAEAAEDYVDAVETADDVVAAQPEDGPAEADQVGQDVRFLCAGERVVNHRLGAGRVHDLGVAAIVDEGHDHPQPEPHVALVRDKELVGPRRRGRRWCYPR